MVLSRFLRCTIWEVNSCMVSKWRVPIRLLSRFGAPGRPGYFLNPPLDVRQERPHPFEWPQNDPKPAHERSQLTPNCPPNKSKPARQCSRIGAKLLFTKPPCIDETLPKRTPHMSQAGSMKEGSKEPWEARPLSHDPHLGANLDSKLGSSWGPTWVHLGAQLGFILGSNLGSSCGSTLASLGPSWRPS